MRLFGAARQQEQQRKAGEEAEREQRATSKGRKATQELEG